jgi:hypothetical protein
MSIKPNYLFFRGSWFVVYEERTKDTMEENTYSNEEELEE